MEAREIADVLENADVKTLHEILRSSEVYLNAQLTAAIAADQRAISMTGYLAAAIVVLIGGAGSIFLSHPGYALLALVVFVVAVCLFYAMRLAIDSAGPDDFEFAGNVAASWLEDVDGKKPLNRSLAEQCAHYDGMALNNNQAMKKNADLLRRAINVTSMTLIIGAIAFATILAVYHFVPDFAGTWKSMLPV